MTARSIKSAPLLLISALLVVGACPALAADDDESEHTGAMEYEIACQPCHGVEGKGDGPKASKLSMPPADLTQIAKRNKGRFPREWITEMIDGRADVAAHGLRDMPVWGDRYRAATLAAGESKEFADESTRDQISELVDYLESIQEE